MLPTKSKSDKIPAFSLSQKEGAYTLTILEDLKSSDIVNRIWREAIPQLESLKPSALVIDASKVDYCDGFGIALFFKIKTLCNSWNSQFSIQNFKPAYQHLLDSFSANDLERQITEEEEKLSHIEFFGKKFESKLNDSIRLIEYIGEIASSLIDSFRNPSKIRWSEVWKVADSTGVDALIIIVLIGFLLGLIMSFQSAIPMQRFGAEIFVANLVSLSLFRELGPLMTAIILAGRSGSAYAAELGTMKVSEELDALSTMGLSPVQFLIIPKIFAAMLVSPLLTIFLNLAGLVGSAVVLISFGYPLVTFTNQVAKAVKYTDLAGGLFKSAVFGLLIACIGALSGLQTKEGASAVGESTTKSVVTGIIVIAVTDGIFSVFFYLLGI